jgi:hypothetical protein
MSPPADHAARMERALLSLEGLSVGDAFGEHERTVETARGALVYRGEVRLDHERRRLLVAERHTLTMGGRTTSADHDFEMRCWTRAELDEIFALAGFDSIGYQGACDPAAPLGSTNRIVAVAARSRARVDRRE